MRSKKCHPTFRMVSNIQQANELLLESFSKEGSNSRFPPSLKTFTDNSIRLKTSLVGHLNLSMDHYTIHGV
jgi:hypothetical protein